MKDIQVSEPASLLITSLAYCSSSSGWTTSLPADASSSLLTNDLYERVKLVFFCILTCSNNKRFASKSFDLTLLQTFGVSSLVPCPKQGETDILEKPCSGIQITKGQDPKQ